MSLEIERKFLVKNNNFKKESFKKIRIEQGYLNSNKKRTVRIRITNNNAFLTIKGKSTKKGTTRFEWEKEIPISDGEKLMRLCEKKPIKKTRYLVKSENHIIEVDIFKGKNKGLILAEIELTLTDENFMKPSWLGEEVTGKKEYYNSFLSKHPFKKWA